MSAGLPTEGENSLHPRAADVAVKEIATASLGETVGDVRARVQATGRGAAVVVDGARVVLGLLRAKELEKDSTQTIEQAMRPGPSSFRPYVPIKQMADYMKGHDLECSPITTSDGKLVGLLYRSDAQAAAEGCPDCVRGMI